MIKRILNEDVTYTPKRAGSGLLRMNSGSLFAIEKYYISDNAYIFNLYANDTVCTISLEVYDLLMKKSRAHHEEE